MTAGVADRYEQWRTPQRDKQVQWTAAVTADLLMGLWLLPKSLQRVREIPDRRVDLTWRHALSLLSLIGHITRLVTRVTRTAWREAEKYAPPV